MRTPPTINRNTEKPNPAPHLLGLTPSSFLSDTSGIFVTDSNGTPCRFLRRLRVQVSRAQEARLRKIAPSKMVRSRARPDPFALPFGLLLRPSTGSIMLGQRLCPARLSAKTCWDLP